MRCPGCGCQGDKVVDSRVIREGAVIRRRRECEKCARRFTTYETIEDITPTIIKRDGRREPYERQKFVRGLVVACQKRPVPRAVIEQGVDSIEGKLFDSATHEVSSTRIGEAAAEFLKQLDPVAYVRFVSVYRSFDDVSQFVTEVIGIRHAPSPPQADSAPFKKPS
jgi:transcriptional repressor NrdR